jgi:1-deoxyxylulose-5-phosphate synthase
MALQSRSELYDWSRDGGRWRLSHPIERLLSIRVLASRAIAVWQFQKALHVAEKYGWTRFVSMQDHLNLICREEEREMLPLCREEKIGVMP